MVRWITTSLSRKLLVSMTLAMGAASLMFLALFVGLYSAKLEESRSEASEQVNRLLQASLENAMLKRDLPGLSDIVDKLATLEQVRDVMIVNPAGEVRFSSNRAMLGIVFDRVTSVGCQGCHASGPGEARPKTRFMDVAGGDQILRSVNPVRNKEPCQECHGAISENPINGVLFIDFDAAGLRKAALTSAVVLSGSGVVVVFLVGLLTWWMIQTVVLLPVRHLARTSQALTAGHLGARVDVHGTDELSSLANDFNKMAESIQKGMREIANKERFLQSVIDGIPDGIRVIGPDYTVIAANDRFCSLVGLSLAEVKARPCYVSSHKRKEPCEEAIVTCPIRELGKSQENSLKCTQEFIGPEGDKTYVEVTAAIERLHDDPEGRVMIIESIRDLSLEMNISHGQRLSELGQLATGIGHEIHNPLASSRISLQTILRLADDGAPDMEEIRDYLSVLDREIDRCVEVTGRLLRLAEPPTKHPIPVRLRAAVDDVVNLLKYEAVLDNVTISVDFEDDALRTIATEGEIRMVVLNLVQNAFHAMPDGGTMRIDGRRDAGWARIDFTDSGVGIPVDQLKRIFEPFISKRADLKHGTGLGLAICKAIVERYDGKLGVSSEVGVGSTFSVTLPDPDAKGE